MRVGSGCSPRRLPMFCLSSPMRPVATQGGGDVAALTSALSGAAVYMAFVGSRRKFAAYGQKLLAAGISQQRLDEVYSPAGVHINAVTPEEIALSIMAEIVKVRRAKGRSEAIDG